MRYFRVKASFATLDRWGVSLGVRASTSDQDAALQVDALQAAGCYRVFVDTISGALEWAA